jgi:hypothetical protein
MQSASMVSKYPTHANMNAKGYVSVILLWKVALASLRKWVNAVPRKTPPPNWVPNTSRPSFHLMKHGEMPPRKVAKKMMMIQYNLT